MIYFIRMWWLRWRLENRLLEIALAREIGVPESNIRDLQMKAQVLANRICTMRLQHIWMRRV
jgi:hypothetical protein